ncbi:XkdF-like putative serine protease domain-containing protein [Halalkalicoccus subterraneus]|uniref:XkdF-like putative serine protease domain-containing protein n=1 Tax=Halalkalicoccus subterraneus TaxID=2675002 RepID=UPI000EFAF2EA|nr:XkdF-like putative serine protease domain-containing protein [Halalkalicoccus subterraneus]
MLTTKQLTGSIVAKDEDERFLLGPVLIPDKPDREGDVVSRENIREVAHKFTEEYQNLDLMHTFESVAKLSESFIARKDLDFGETTVPAGSWMLGVKVEDDEVWSQVKSGELSGFSIYGQGERSPVTSMSSKGVSSSETGGKSSEDMVAKSASPEEIAKEAQLDLDRVTFVSLVDEPAVGESKYVVMKRAGEDVPEEIAKAANADDVEVIEDVEDLSSERRSIEPLTKDAPDDDRENRIATLAKSVEQLPEDEIEAFVKKIEGNKREGSSENVSKGSFTFDEDDEVSKGIDEKPSRFGVSFASTVEKDRASGEELVEKAREATDGSGSFAFDEAVDKSADVEDVSRSVGSVGSIRSLDDLALSDVSAEEIEDALSDLSPSKIWELEKELAKRSGRKGRTTELDRELHEAEESNAHGIVSSDGAFTFDEAVESDD